MANWQALTFGGFDPLGTEGESRMSFAWNGKDMRRNIRYQKRMIRFQNEQTKGMSLWSAHQMPSATMQGLKSAGLNPLLAAGGSTNVAPTVASSAASVPYSESFASGGVNGQSGDLNSVVDLFSGTSSLERKARKVTAQATEEQGKASLAEQKARSAWFNSEEGKKAVKNKLRMDYGPQSPMNAAVLGAHTAADAANSIVDAHNAYNDGGTDNPVYSWIRDKANKFDRWFWEKDNPRSYFYDGPEQTRKPSSNPKPKSKPAVTHRRDSHDRNRTEYHFHFGGSAKNYDSGSKRNSPVWYNPDLK